MNLKLAFFLSLVSLSVLGLITVFSVAPHQFNSQLIFFCIAILLFIFFAKQSSHVYLGLGLISYLLSLFLLVLPLVIGVRVKGASRWLAIGSWHLQPSEITKPLLILSYSYFLTRYPPITLNNIVKNIFLIVTPSFLIFFQPDLGTTLLYLLLGFGMLFVAGLPFLYCFVSLILLAFSTLFIPHLLKPYQLQRIKVFLSPTSDPLGAGYNVIQSILAVGAGSLWGQGIKSGIQSKLSFLPEHYTDFIFASYSEQFGFLGDLFLLFFLILLLYTLLSLALRQSSLQKKLIVFGVFFSLFVQSFLNIAMNIGLAPVTGITLPLISVGGSSLIATFISLGIAFAFLDN